MAPGPKQILIIQLFALRAYEMIKIFFEDILEQVQIVSSSRLIDSRKDSNP